MKKKPAWLYTVILSLVKHVNCFPIFFFENEEDTKKGYHEYYFVKHSLNIISVHCACLCVYIYICQHPSNQYWSNIYWDGSFKQDLTFLKNRFLLQVLKWIFVKDSLLRDYSWTLVVCFLKFCKLKSERKANFNCVKNIWISIYKEICNFDCEKSLFIWNHIKCVCGVLNNLKNE